MITLKDIEKAHDRIRPFIHRTPILTNSSLNELSGAELFFKCENFQKAGSFKIRGATNAVQLLSQEDLKKGIATTSSGNHGAALSMAVTRRGGKTHVVMPHNTPKIKVENVKRNGGEIVWCETSQESREGVLEDLVKKNGSEVIHPYNDERIIGNLGFGKRILNSDKTMMTGFNAFFDYDDIGNARSSLGLEARNATLDFGYNYYFKIDDGTDEKVLDGYDLRLASQIPYVHWADLFVNSYEWEGRDRDDIKGMKIGSALLLSPTLNLELAFDDKDKDGLEDEWYANITFVHPPRSGPSLQDGFLSDSAWKEEKDMSGELLTKVNRNNKIVVEFKGLATISRTD